jgi:hypothetical protein
LEESLQEIMEPLKIEVWCNQRWYSDGFELLGARESGAAVLRFADREHTVEGPRRGGAARPRGIWGGVAQHLAHWLGECEQSLKA